MTYVLSDIHGRGAYFHNILEQIDLGLSDHLYVLGDVIDRNPDGIDLLFELMDMPNATLLLGNHEHMMLECLEHPEDRRLDNWLIRNGGAVTLAHYLELSPQKQEQLRDYLHALPLNLTISVKEREYLLVHGAPLSFFQKYPTPRHQDPRTYTVWVRMAPYMQPQDGKTIIFGHTCTRHYQEASPMEVWFGNSMIGIDCGAAYENGRLACLRLEDQKVFYSA